MPTFYALMLDQYFENELAALTGMRYEARRSVDYGKHYDGMLLCVKGGDNTLFTMPSLMGGDSPYEYAARLATHVWEKHFKEDSPEFKLLPDVLGVLTQLDNMIAGMTRENVKPAQEYLPRRHTHGRRFQ